MLVAPALRRALLGVLLLMSFAVQGKEYRLSADQHYHVGVEHYSGGSYALAIEHLTAAARQGHLEAQEILAFLFLNADYMSRGQVHRDRCAGRRWLRIAALNGSEAAQRQLPLLQLRMSGEPNETCPERKSR